eukprot:638590-Pyramimonas_sp.AAC.1
MRPPCAKPSECRGHWRTANLGLAVSASPRPCVVGIDGSFQSRAHQAPATPASSKAAARAQMRSGETFSSLPLLES